MRPLESRRGNVRLVTRSEARAVRALALFALPTRREASSVAAVQDAEMQKRRYNIGALHDEGSGDVDVETVDADNTLMAAADDKQVSLVVVLGPALPGLETAFAINCTFRQWQIASDYFEFDAN